MPDYRSYGSIGWSVGAVLGYSVAAGRQQPNKRVMAFIGDGSFQVRTRKHSATHLRHVAWCWAPTRIAWYC